MKFVKPKSLLYRFIIWFYLANALFFLLAGCGYLKAILYSGTLFANSVEIYAFTTNWGKIFVLFFALVNYLTYMTLLAFIPALFLLFVALLFSSKRVILVLSVLFSVICLMLLIVDSQVYSMFKFHLNSAILSMIFSKNSLMIFDFSAREILTMIVTIGLVLLIEVLLAYGVWKTISKRFSVTTNRIKGLSSRTSRRIRRRVFNPNSYKIEKIIFWIWFGGFVFCYTSLITTIGQNVNIISQQTPNLPLFNLIYSYLIPDENAKDILTRYSEDYFSQPLFAKDSLNYPLHAMQCDKPVKPYNIILIMVDSLRADNLNEQIMPQLTHFAHHNWNFSKYYSGGNGTQPGLFSLFYSIPGTYWTAAFEQQKAPIFNELIKKNNYQTRVLWSGILRSPPFDKTIYLGLNHLSNDDEVGVDVGDSDRRITHQAINFLTKTRDKRPFFLNLFYDAAHGFCRKQSFSSIYESGNKPCSRIALHSKIDPRPYYNRYLNAVTFIDQEIGTLLQVIEKNGYLKNSIVIITSDHGQEFNETKQNYWGHACNFTRYQVQVPFVIHWPNESPRQFNYLTTSYDVMPTLFQKLFACKNPVSDYSIGQNLLKESGRLPFELTVSYVNMGIIESDRITTLQASGQIVITDSDAKVLVRAEPKTKVIQQAMHLMRRYFL